MSNVTEIMSKLGCLADLRKVSESLTQELGGLVDQAFLNCPDLDIDRRQVLEEREQLSSRLDKLTQDVRKAVIKHGSSVKDGFLQVIFSKGKTTWDGKKLDGFALAHPGINRCKKVGSSSVSIREVREVKKE